jgi:membrane-associated phospholipid phosphatase
MKNISFYVKIILLFCLLFLYALNIYAQDSSINYKAGVYVFKNDTLFFEHPNLFNNVRNIPEDVWQLAKSPFQNKNLAGLAVVAATTTILILKDQQLINWVKKTSKRVNLNPQAKYNVLVKAGDTKILKTPKNFNTTLYQLGEGGTSMLVAGGLLTYGLITKNKRATATAYDLAETFITMGITTQILKRSTGRQSPFAATVHGGKWSPFPAFKNYQTNTGNYDAFPSGHLATMMATVTVLSSNYPEKKWIKPLGYSLIGLSGWAMMNAEVHWAGDYPLAIAIGYLSGKITTWRHKKAVVKKVIL